MSTSSLGYWSSVVAHQYFARLQEKLAHLDITQWFYVLLTIEEGKGQWSQQELADRLSLDKVSMTRAIDHLCEKGYVERCDCAGDRRKHLVKLTPKSRSTVKTIRTAYDELNTEALAGLKKTERDAFMAHLMLLVKNLSEMGAPVAITNKRVHA